VHAVDIRIGRDNDPIITQPVEAFLDVKRALQEVKLLVFVDDFL